MERGDADWTPIPPVDADGLNVRYPSRVHLEPSLTTAFFFLNTRAPPFDDLRVRRALNLAVDRRMAVAILGGPRLAAPACQLLPPGMPGYRPYCPYTVHPDPAGTWIAPDLVRARALVKASGTQGMPVTVWASDLDPTYAPLARYVAAVLHRLGYRSSVRTLPHDNWGTVVADSRRRAQLGPIIWVADFPTPTNFYDFFLACSSFVPGDPAHTSNGSELLKSTEVAGYSNRV